jgi:hypothetical protein
MPPPIQSVDDSKINLIENIEVLDENIPAQFPMTDDQFSNFTRTLVSRKMDCVINGLSIINIINQQQADILRIITGDRGIYTNIYENIFRYILPSKKWKQVPMSGERLLNFAIHSLKPGHLLFCFYAAFGWYPPHIYVIGKDRYGNVIHIDPQQSPVTCYILKPEDVWANYDSCISRFGVERKHEVLCSFPSLI